MIQWLREVRIEYGEDIPGSVYGPRTPWKITSKSDNDLRVTFRCTRTNTARSDAGRLNIFNMPEKFRDAIVSGVKEANTDRAFILADPRNKNDFDRRNDQLRQLAQANRIKIFAGYQGSTQLIFTGDIKRINNRSLRSAVDTVMDIELGDAIITFKFGWFDNNVFGAGTQVGNLLSTIVVAAGGKMSQQSLKFLAETVPGVAVSEFRNGMVIQGDITRNIDAIVGRYGVQWFFRDGEFFMMPRGSVLDDFALRLDQGTNVLDPIGNIEGEDIKFRMLIDGRMTPGRGFRIHDRDGKPTSVHGYRADTVEYSGDTHGNPWYNTIIGSRISAANFPEPFIVLTPAEAFSATESVVALP